MKQMLIAFALALTLGVSAFAGGHQTTAQSKLGVKAAAKSAPATSIAKKKKKHKKSSKGKAKAKK